MPTRGGLFKSGSTIILGLNLNHAPFNFEYFYMSVKLNGRPRLQYMLDSPTNIKCRGRYCNHTLCKLCMYMTCTEV